MSGRKKQEADYLAYPLMDATTELRFIDSTGTHAHKFIISFAHSIAIS